MPRVHRFQLDTRSPASRIEGEQLAAFDVAISGLRDKRTPEDEPVTAIFHVRTSMLDGHGFHDGPPVMEALGGAMHRVRELGFAFTNETAVEVERVP